MSRIAVYATLLCSLISGCGEKTAGSATPERLSGRGESCLKSSDCVAGTKCLEQKCVAEDGADSPTPEALSRPQVIDEGVRAPPEAQANTLEELAQSVHRALRGGDYESFSVFVLAASDVVAMMKERGATDAQIQSLGSEELNEKLKRSIRRAKEGWERVRAKGEESGIVWSETSYSRIDYEMKQEGTFKRADVEVMILYRGIEYRFELDDCLQTTRGWVMTDNMRWLDARHTAATPTGELPAACAKYISTMRRCFEVAPVEARRAAQDAFDQTTKAWQAAARNGAEAVHALESGCKSAWDAAKSGMGAMCPDVSWQ